jgi:hypothetical protein
MSLTSRRVLTVFLASPGDLEAERKVTREVVDRLNKSLCRPLDIVIDLRVWEDTLPGVGRPQARINADVDGCDLFVGLLWQRWGTPTGTHSSGFEEEFERARDRFRSSHTPEIWLHFKYVAQASVADPGPELRQVLAFREALVQAREIQFKTFTETLDWERTLHSNLGEYIALLAKEVTATEEAQAARSAPEAPALRASAHDAVLSPSLTTAARSWHDATLSQDTSAFSDVPAKQAARMLMSVKTWTSILHTQDVLGTHDANFIFLHRESCDLVSPEPQFVFRCLLADTGDVIPGWYWLRDVPPEVFQVWTESGFSDGVTAIRRGATTFLTKWPGNPLLSRVSEHFPRLLTDLDEFVRKNTVNALLALANEEALLMLEEASGQAPDEGIVDARQQVGLRLRPDAELARIIVEAKPISSRVRKQALAEAARIEEATARRGLSSPEPRLRYLSALLLKAKGALDETMARGLLADEAFGVRRVALLALIAMGASLTLAEVHRTLDENKSGTTRADFLRDGSEKPDEHVVVTALLEAKEESELESTVDFYRPDGREAYSVLARKYFPSVGQRVRRDLDDDFATLRSESQEKLRPLLKENAEVLMKAIERNDEYIRRNLTEAALAGLAEHATEDDVGRARKVLALPGNVANSDVMAHAIVILTRFGTRDDVPRLVALASEKKGLPWWVRENAADLALRLGDHEVDVVDRLLATSDVAIINTVFRTALDGGAPVQIEQAAVLLRHEDAAVRQAAVAYLSLHLSREEVEAALKTYMSAGTYYYNVVAGLNEAAFVPEWLRPSLVARLKTRLERQTFAEVFSD